EFEPIFEELQGIINQLGGGLIAEHVLLDEITSDATLRNHIYFLLVVGIPFYRSKENNSYAHRWYTEKKIAESVEKALVKLHSNINRDDLISEEEMIRRFKEELIDIADKHDETTLKRWLQISKDISANPLGEWGHASSPNVRVKGI